MDSAYRVPGTTLRFGVDPIVGLVPGLGDFVTPAFSIAVIYRAFRLGVPRVVQIRMLINVLVDLFAGMVPVVGDLFDVAWKSNDMNLALLERHVHPGTKPGSGDWAFVLLVFIVIGGTAALVAMSCAWVVYSVFRPFR